MVENDITNINYNFLNIFLLYLLGQDITHVLNFKNFGRKPESKWYFKGKEVSKSDRISFNVTRTMVSMTIKNVINLNYIIAFIHSLSDYTVKDRKLPISYFLFR